MNGRGQKILRGARGAAGVVLVAASLMSGPACADSRDDVRAAFDRFVAAQNDHDAKAVAALLLNSPDFLWITRGTAVWGHEAAMKRFGALYEGTWRLDPELADMKVTVLGDGVAQVYVPINFTIGAAGQPAQQTRFLMNQVLIKSQGAWLVSSILPIPVPAPSAAK
jgi:uncharacterized protein (TIGR02246 family)